MFLPSRPISLAFISSLGRGTTETVISDAWSAAQRWTARAIIFFASAEASSFAVASIFLTCKATSCLVSSNISSASSFFASSLVSWAIFSSSWTISSCWWFTFSCVLFNSCSLTSSPFFCCSNSLDCFKSTSSFLYRISSFCTRRCSCFCSSCFFSLHSLSHSANFCFFSSSASRLALLLIFSQSRLASSLNLSVLSLALPNSFSMLFPLSFPPMKNAATARQATIPSNTPNMITGMSVARNRLLNANKFI